MKRSLAIAVAVVLAIFALASARLAPPPIADAPPDRFSGERARVLQRELTEAGPRPTGSPGNAKGRAILRGALERAGFAVEEQRGFACGRHGSCANVVNVVAKKAGRDPGAAPVLLLAHHDSVTCSPGASDDGVGAAAVVEAARALAASPAGTRPLLVLLTDGEEDGLLGAELFAKDHPSVFAAVNVDARGGRGASALFETSADSAWLVGLASRVLDRPVTSSLFFEVYKRMPNDTDFTVVKAFAHGVGLANIAGIEAYHTPNDDLSHADPGTLEHHGTQVVALARALMEASDAEPPGQSVWFDVLALFVVRWPSSTSLPLALAALAMALVRAIRSRAWDRGLVAAPAAVALGALAAAATGFALRAPTMWIAHAAPAYASLHLTTIAASVGTVRAIGGTPRAQWSGAWLMWSLLAVAVAVIAPGASFLFTVPALAAGFAAFLPIGAACAASAAVAAIVWAPVALLFPDGLGLAIPAALALPTALLASTIAPLLHAAPRRTVHVATAGAALLAITSLLLPRFTPDVPERVNVVVAEDGASTRALVAASWGPAPTGPTPATMLRGDERIARVVPWLLAGPTRDVPRLGLAPPVVDDVTPVASSDRRRVRAHVRSMRGARTLILELPLDRRAEAWVHGQHATPRWGNLVALRAIGPEGVDIELAADGAAPLDLTLYDMTPGVPDGAAPSRPPYAVQTQDGDSTVALTRAKL